MELTVNYMGGAAFEAGVRGHRVICDQPASNGGQDLGFSPPEFLLASLGTCAAFYALQYLKTRNLPDEGLRVSVSADKALNPARLAAFRINIVAPGIDDERHIAGLFRAAKTCLIHNTLLNAPAIDIRVNAPPAGAAAGGA